MAKIYAALIIKGVKTMDDVPDKLKDTVKAIWKVITDVLSVDHKITIQKGCADYGNYLCNLNH